MTEYKLPEPTFADALVELGFDPENDQADSDRMACKLRIEVQFGAGLVTARDQNETLIHHVFHNDTDEDVCRAVREARLLVAVEIGRACK